MIAYTGSGGSGATSYPGGSYFQHRTLRYHAYPNPTVAIDHVDPFICPDESITLTASGGSSYQWSNGATSPSITVSLGPYTTTTYSVQAISS